MRVAPRFVGTESAKYEVKIVFFSLQGKAPVAEVAVLCVLAAELGVSLFHALCVLAEVRSRARGKQINQFIFNNITIEQ